MNGEEQHQEAPIAKQHEPDRIYSGPVSLTVAGLVALVGVSLLLIHGVLLLLERAAPSPLAPSLVQLPAEAPGGPRLIPDQCVQLEQLRRQEDRLLSAYGWVDRDQGIARIPIGRAISILADRELQSPSTGKENRNAK